MGIMRVFGFIICMKKIADLKVLSGLCMKVLRIGRWCKSREFVICQDYGRPVAGHISAGPKTLRVAVKRIFQIIFIFIFEGFNYSVSPLIY